MPASAFEDDVRRVLERLTEGSVVTYGEVAREAGYPGAARAVGTFLSRGPDGIPWWRVVTSTGRLVPGHEVRQVELLKAVGVAVANGRVVAGRR
jgi:methylated-DNA-protein-cysteine methyltransferase-like protein